MKNSEKFKTADERINAFERYHSAENSHCDVCPSHNVRCLGSKTAKGYLCYQSWFDLEAYYEKPMPCPFCNNEYVEVVKGDAGMREVACICGYRSQARESETEAIVFHNRLYKAVAAMNCNVKIGDTIAYRTLEDNDHEWKSFTVRLINDGMLYEHEDKSGDNIAIACAHKVIVSEGEVR